jgi:hypothetical protein
VAGRLRDDKELAIEEARRMGEGGRQLALRVVEERVDPSTGRGSFRPIFRISKIQRSGKTERVESQDNGVVEQRVERMVRGEQVRRRSNRAGWLPTIAVRLALLAALIGAGSWAVTFVRAYLDRHLS